MAHSLQMKVLQWVMHLNKWLPIEPGQVRLYFMVYLRAIVGALLYFLIGLLNKKDNTQCLSSFKEMNLALGVKNVFKMLGMAVLLFAACYAVEVQSILSSMEDSCLSTVPSIQ